MQSSQPTNSFSIRRLGQELRDLQKDPAPEYFAMPVENDIFQWHFTIKGPKDTPYQEGYYHGYLALPFNYPFKPPSLYFLTPSGRWKVKEKICLTFTSFHPEEWQPSWTIRTMLQAIISYMPITESITAVGALQMSEEQCKGLAKESHNFICPQCGKISAIIDKMKEVKEENKKVVELPGKPILIRAEEKKEEEKKGEEKKIEQPATKELENKAKENTKTEPVATEAPAGKKLEEVKGLNRESREEESKKDDWGKEVKKEEIKKEEAKKEEAKQEEGKKEEAKQEEGKKEEAKQEEAKQEEQKAAPQKIKLSKESRKRVRAELKKLLDSRLKILNYIAALVAIVLVAYILR